MSEKELKSTYLALEDEQRAIVLERVIEAVTSFARRFYRGRSVSDFDARQLAVANELAHSVAGYVVQYRHAPESVRADLLWDTLFEKVKECSIDLAHIVESVLASQNDAKRLASLATKSLKDAGAAQTNSIRDAVARHGVAEAAQRLGITQAAIEKVMNAQISHKAEA